MPQPAEPPNRESFLGPDERPTRRWQQWFTSMWSALNSRQFYIPAGAGAPSFTPESRANFVAVYYDTSNEKLYVYNGGWVSVTLA